ncbi:hypothetical protein IL38_20570 [Actinopolyspora erythraea]|uniref:Orotidine 5'-phosphate decarboxylase domain-containing protein n=1 Tax=Actinopolyspora erythraea TaxID=414996 RepID=A0ABR4WZL7_9ACTN|nr:orotidine 5'-phosphate decarboxylase / HUMPS family protein [Actinopolyspora erythraea]KGI79855.1 hypothetical protein IL38_20570 [Actinopolyspora erythraea]
MFTQNRSENPPASEGTLPRTKPLLQVAFDFVDASEATRILAEIAPVIDIAEVGTSMLKTEGVGVIERFRRTVPETLVLADAKTMDDADYETRLVLEAGADMTTVCATAADTTISRAVARAHQYRGKVVCDLVGTRATRRRLRRLSELGADYVGIHNGLDERADNEDLSTQLAVCEAMGIRDVQLSGGITPESVRELRAGTPSIVVVGGYVLGSPEPRDAVERIRQALAGRFPGESS